MRQKKEIVVEILDSGEVKIETVGFTGKACIQESAWLKRLLGKEQAKELKACYFENGEVKVKKHLPICG